MASQAELFVSVMKPPKAPEGRKSPRLWIRRLAIFKDGQTVIRNVSLKPGLNIVWTPDMATTGQRALAHGSGKTTFCRLLRACLGEPGYATDSQRLRLMAQLPDGLFAAEILIEDVCWVAIRPLGLPGGEFVVKADTIEEAVARGRQINDRVTIDPVIADCFFATLVAATPPEVNRAQIWDVLRAWLTRDQECRLADILAWRSSQTQTHSRAQVLGETAKLTMMRLALRALDAEERAAAAQERELVGTIEDERRRHAYLQQRFSDGLKTTSSALGVTAEVGFEDTIDQKGLLSLAEEALAGAMRTPLPKPPDVAAIFARFEAFTAEREALITERQQLNNDAQLKSGEAERCRSEANLGAIDITQGKIRICPVCRVSVNEILAAGCGISLEQCDLAALKQGIAAKQEKARDLDAEARGAQRESKRVDARMQQLEPKRVALENEIKAADVANRTAQAVTKEIQDRIYQARRTLDEVRMLHESARNEEPSLSGSSALEIVRAQLEAGRTRARAAIKSLEVQFQGIMVAWLPEGISSFIKLDGHGLKVDAEFAGRGEISTGALDSLKIVAFDLAALHMAIEEQIDLPAFLIHDSPREADLDGQLYAGLFNLVHQWEEAGAPCFQYIITTTTAPPPGLQHERLVRLQMSSTPAEMRLFAMDI